VNDDLRALYQDLILDHARHPRNAGTLAEPARRATGYNPLCGDKVALAVQVDDQDRITAVRFEGQGCAISTASASLMTEAVAGKTVIEANQMIERFHQLMTAKSVPAGAESLGDLRALEGVREYPVRVKCATLAWHALRSALLGSAERVSTETTT
jgi:nitrogen fixation NifU-like protein